MVSTRGHRRGLANCGTGSCMRRCRLHAPIAAWASSHWLTDFQSTFMVGDLTDDDGRIGAWKPQAANDSESIGAELMSQPEDRGRLCCRSPGGQSRLSPQGTSGIPFAHYYRTDAFAWLRYQYRGFSRLSLLTSACQRSDQVCSPTCRLWNSIRTSILAKTCHP